MEVDVDANASVKGKGENDCRRCGSVFLGDPLLQCTRLAAHWRSGVEGGGAKWERLGVVGCLCSAPNQVQQQHKYGVVVVVVVAAVGSRGKITVIPIQQSRIR